MHSGSRKLVFRVFRVSLRGWGGSLVLCLLVPGPRTFVKHPSLDLKSRDIILGP